MPFTISPDVDAMLAAQIEEMRRQAEAHKKVPERPRPFVTVSREFGCQGYPMSESLYRKLNERQGDGARWTIWDRELATKVAEASGISSDLLEALSAEQRSVMLQVAEEFFGNRPSDFQVYEALFQVLYGLAQTGHVILLGHGAAVATNSIDAGIHVRIYGSQAFRVRKLMDAHGISESAAREMARAGEAEREAFVRKYANADIRDPQHYHLVLNNDLLSPDEMAEITVRLL